MFTLVKCRINLPMGYLSYLHRIISVVYILRFSLKHHNLSSYQVYEILRFFCLNLRILINTTLSSNFQERFAQVLGCFIFLDGIWLFSVLSSPLNKELLDGRSVDFYFILHPAFVFLLNETKNMKYTTDARPTKFPNPRDGIPN